VGGTPARRGKLLLVLEQELSVFDRGESGAVIAYFEVYPDAYHHPQEDMVFKKLNARDPAAAANIGDLAAEHRSGAKRLRRVAQAVESIQPRSRDGRSRANGTGKPGHHEFQDGL